MGTAVGILVVCALLYGALRFFKSRAKKHADRLVRAEKRAKSIRSDAKAFQRTLDGRR